MTMVISHTVTEKRWSSSRPPPTQLKRKWKGMPMIPINENSRKTASLITSTLLWARLLTNERICSRNHLFHLPNIVFPFTISFLQLLTKTSVY